ncbi:DUF4384 domain-containing protein [Treponema sp. R80B11-R83G3]
MKPNTAYRGASALLLIMAIYFCTVPVTAHAGGKKEQYTNRQEGKILLRTEPSDFSEKDKTIPLNDNGNDFYFLGISEPCDTKAKSFEGAKKNADLQILQYCGELIEIKGNARSKINGNTRNTFEVFVNREDEITRYAQKVLSEVTIVRYSCEVWLTIEKKEEYIGYVVCKISKQKVEDEINNFAKNLSERYVNLLTHGETIATALESYVMVAKALEQNSLHRITAFYENQNGITGLYEYVMIKINELANSVSIEQIPGRSILENESLYTPIKLRSSIMPSTGFLTCQARLIGGSDDIKFQFKTSSDDPYNLPVRNLKPGTYTVAIEVLFSEITGGIAKNASGGFSLEVKPLNAVYRTAQEMEAGIKKAVDILAENLQVAAETKIGPFFMTGTDIPSGLSRYLDERIRHYAINNHDKKYRIVTGETAETKNILNGFFTKRNDLVSVILQLATPSGNGDGSQSFFLAVAELERMGISIEPENIAVLPERDKIIKKIATEEGIKINAEFNSESGTYLHRDSLEMNIRTDKNSYIKIYHIVNDQMKMIYPNSIDRDNKLKANEWRSVFETASYYLYEPYGVETILIVASMEQYENIEREYITPWRVITEESLRNAITGNRGGDLEFSAIKGEARFNICVLKPDEEFEYKRPQNMTETYQGLRENAIKQGGFFQGGETSGVFIIGNTRGSYRIPRDRPDMIQFASYNLNSYKSDSNTGTSLRGENGYNFSFTKPVNISQAIQTIRREIEDKGGVFIGNEQQGSFHVCGIAGLYLVTELVTITITTKPIIIPYALIEKEIRSYFGGG